MTTKHLGSYVGAAVVDVTAVAPKLVDIQNGELQGYRRSKPGLDGVLGELAKVMPTHGDAARIHPSSYQDITETVSLLQKLAALRPEAEKLAEVLRESQVYYEDQLENLIHKLGKVVIDTAKQANEPGLLAMFQKTLEYRTAYAEKAAATRKRNEHAQEEPTTQTEGTP